MIELACKEIAFHFNKKHLEDPSIPMWTLKTGGKSYYVEHIDANIPFSTKETPDNSHTKGSIKFKNAHLCIENGTARIEPLTNADKARLSGKRLERCVSAYKGKIIEACEENGLDVPELKHVTGSCGTGFYLFEMEPKDATVLALTLPAYVFRTLAATDPLYARFENHETIDADYFDLEESSYDA